MDFLILDALDQYYGRVGITSPAYWVYRIAGHGIRERAAHYFSGRLLDVGCGTKAKQLLVGDLVDEYVGLDHEASPHGLARVDLVGTAYEIPEADGAFDCILCTAVLEHLEDPARALRESLRVLRPGGYALYTVPLFWPVHEEPRDFFRYTEFGCRYLFENAGFDIIEIAPMSGYWITAGVMRASFINSMRLGRARVLVSAAVAVVHLVTPILDRLERRFNRGAHRWTWMYVVVARKPES